MLAAKMAAFTAPTGPQPMYLQEYPPAFGSWQARRPDRP